MARGRRARGWLRLPYSVLNVPVVGSLRSPQTRRTGTHWTLILQEATVAFDVIEWPHRSMSEQIVAAGPPVMRLSRPVLMRGHREGPSNVAQR